jgi:hypothetical protein
MTVIIESEIKLAKPKGLLKEVSAKSAIENLLCSPVEACSGGDGKVIPVNCHAFMVALHAAYFDHRPFVLSPDMIWLLIAQGFANHVTVHAEELRSHFVDHDGKKELRVKRNDFVKGSIENPWENVFDEFSSHIRDEIGVANHNLIVGEFSTTSSIEKAANEIVLMDSVKAYFEVVLETRCGIPEIRLEGTTEDWKKLAEKTWNLGVAFDLQWWTDRMLPTLETIAAHANGREIQSFGGISTNGTMAVAGHISMAGLLISFPIFA